MYQSQYPGKYQQRIEAYLRQRQARSYEHLNKFYQASRRARQQYVSASPPAPPNIIDGVVLEVGSGNVGIYQQGLQHIEKLRLAIYRQDVRILIALVVALICGYYQWFWLALDLLGFAGVLLYLKFYRAAKALCPRCQQPFGSVQRLPTRLGGDRCQHCDLSIQAMKRGYLWET